MRDVTRGCWVVALLCLTPVAWAAEETTPPPASQPPAAPAELLTADEALQRLASKDPLEREKGVYELGMLKAKEQLPRVAAALNDRNLDVRRAALVATRLIQGKEAVPTLEHMAQTAKQSVLREQAIHELGAVQAVGALPVIVRAWQKDRDPEVRLAALEAMGTLKDPSVVPHLTRALKRRDARMRRSAAIGLGHLGQLAKPAVPPLIKRLRGDPDENVRVNAAEALYRIGDARAITPLLHALSDRADRVHLPAFKALDAWAQPGMEALLAPYLNRGRPHVRIYAAKLLSKIGTEPALALLKARLARETHEKVKPILVDAVHAIERKAGHTS